ncbi:hypothetical protein [Streptomyces sp. NPDC020681]|uniref:hypothetical protein n=1 Tax=Streptomyces sp. NPDC020681 TaxID=3365083 RepID=UPI0037AFAB7A
MGAAFSSIATGIASSLVYSLAAAALAVAIWRVRARRYRKIWAEALRFRAESLIILSARAANHIHDVPRCSASEVRALVKATALLQRFRTQNYFRVSTDVSDDELRSRNLIVLGSGRANVVAARAFRSLSPPGLSLDTVGRTIRLNGRTFAPEYDDDSGALVVDYALIIKAANPFRHYQSQPRTLLMFMGLHGIGTEGAVLAATDRSPLLDIARQVDGDDFMSVIKVDVNGFLVTDTQVEISVRL